MNNMLELDACCGYKRMWKGKDISNIVFVDIKKEVKPTLVADAKHLPFRDGIFNKIYCDPPHMLQHHAGPNSKIHKKFYEVFGWFNNRGEWISFIGRTNIEFKRVLKANGVLWYKLIDGKDFRIVHLADLNYMDNFVIIEKKIVRKANEKWRKNVTYEVILKVKTEP